VVGVEGAQFEGAGSRQRDPFVDGLQLLVRRVVRGELIERVAGHQVEQVGLVADVVIQGRRADVEALCDGPHREAVDTVRADDSQGGVGDRRHGDAGRGVGRRVASGHEISLSGWSRTGTV
jgi:hypothetical protein